MLNSAATYISSSSPSRSSSSFSSSSSSRQGASVTSLPSASPSIISASRISSFKASANLHIDFSPFLLPGGSILSVLLPRHCASLTISVSHLFPFLRLCQCTIIIIIHLTLIFSFSLSQTFDGPSPALSCAASSSIHRAATSSSKQFLQVFFGLPGGLRLGTSMLDTQPSVSPPPLLFAYLNHFSLLLLSA